MPFAILYLVCCLHLRLAPPAYAGVPQRRYALSVLEGHTTNPVCVGGSCLTDDDEGDVSVSMLSGWCVTSGLDAATPVPANVVEPSEPSECECKSASYGRWDGDGLYTSGLESSGRVCVRKLCAQGTAGTHVNGLGAG